MPSPVIGVRPGWTPIGATIDSAHPLAAGLVLSAVAVSASTFWCHGYGPVTLTTAGNSRATLSETVTGYGRAAKYVGSGVTWSFDSWRFPCVSTQTARLTVAVICGTYATSAPWAGNSQRVVELGANTNRMEFANSTGYPTFSAGRWSVATGSTYSSGAALHLVGVSNKDDSSARSRLYQNGSQVASAYDGTFVETAFTEVTLCSDISGTGNNGLNGFVGAVQVWGRALGPSEIAALAANPFCMLRR